MNNQKLISASKTMQLVLWVMLVALFLMVIIPWAFPTTGLGKFLLSIQNFNNFMDTYHKNIDDFMSNLRPISRLFGIIASIITVLPLVIGIKIMLNVADNYKNGQVFTLNNAKSYRLLGVIYLIEALLLKPLSDIFFTLCATFNNPVGQRTIAFGFTLGNMTAIFFAIILIMIGHVMVVGQKMNEEQQFTV
ncbi:MAG: hypothetical protein K0R14_2038 [Burkholderiales bacterium]|jgi:hypothetical protein|nr:hypothetical protein [Burkholderiales bacterium]